MTDENQPEINVWQGIPTNLLASQTRTRSEHCLISRGISVNFLASRTRTHSTLNSGAACVRYAANITKDDFNRDVHVDVRSIAGKRVQARNYEIPEAVAVNGDENQEHRNDKLIVDARPLPWYIRIDLRLFCCLKIIFIVHIGCEFTY